MTLSMQPNEINGIPHVRRFLKELLETIDNPDIDIVEKVNRILSYIPAQASENNKLTDTNFVNSSIGTNTATFRGTSEAGLTEEQFLTWANSLTKDNNDYIFWNTTDSDGNIIFKRYKYNGTVWGYEYSLNNSSFTAAQWAAIQSGITASIVQNLHDSDKLVRGDVVYNIVTLTQAQYDALATKDVNTEYNII